MISALIGLLVLIIIIGIIFYVLRQVLNLIPMEENFKQIALVMLLLVCVLVVLAKALPLIGVSLPM